MINLWRTLAARAAVAFVVPAAANGLVAAVLLYVAGPEALEITGPFGLVEGYGHLILAPYWLLAEIWGLHKKSFAPLRSYLAFIGVFYTVYGPVLVFAPLPEWPGFAVAYASGSVAAIAAAWYVTWLWHKSQVARAAQRDAQMTDAF
ncbi:hypothetical protein ABAC460_21705 [Asticcacaulis sp. AC460]|uniref:hypothetical protein n=1 Tax=Asticcacaulis sp. AC460 TaxID=1282360 RepID=UPI0003C3E5D3|nr:hypothetical protein [Asticcacaulis sp. AC460]ESQ86998.1 hypothetical protein ABAC460_21705 [Asticcacaulis sp. AC460]